MKIFWIRRLKILEHAHTDPDQQSLIPKCLTLGLGENSIWPGGKEPFAAGFQHNEWLRGERVAWMCIFLLLDISAVYFSQIESAHFM